MRLSSIIRAVNARVSGPAKECFIHSFSTDSRTIKTGELFIALNGKNFQGSEFIPDAVKKGAAAVITDICPNCHILKKIPVLFVQNSENALALIAKEHRRAFDIPFICVVGSNGKTTTKDLISHILSAKYNVLKTEANYNNLIGVAKTLLRLRGHNAAVIEAGSNSPGEISRSASIIRPDIVITTNIGMSHLQGLKTLAGVLKEKTAMVKALPRDGVWVKNFDDKMLMTVRYKGIREIGFALSHTRACFRARRIRQGWDGTSFCVNSEAFFLPLIGTHNVYNAAAAIAVSSLFMDIGLIKEAISSFKASPGRMQIDVCRGGFRLINDTYNANPASLVSAVSALKSQSRHGKNYIVCADMLELGNRADKLHYACGKFIAKSKAADLLVLFGSHINSMAKGASDGGMKNSDIKIFKDKMEIVDFFRRRITKGDTVLVKGSRSMRMEEIVSGLSG
ncbi:MAG: UDP-N-acetylmuramoyl-tripeptide--D-alanyl-D-alanine ligase [Candidatus Omnitrophica bacterium]|jgi:UDP-N-acetylmuramoyl-tripeptide--D-alanyl-D-alanine ligase|nr:UDP-N-acetylmuramoyl-tripeptide--D-alanyl-D-alanine ligase [Candidatus Omnitrophota bacterium]